MRLHVAHHPLITHKLTVLRDRETPSATFRQLVDELVTLLAYEATREVAVTETHIQTPVAPTVGLKLSEPRPIVVPVLRAATNYLFERGAKDVTCVCILAAPEGIKTLEEAIGDRADVNVVVAAVDDHLNEKSYIVPGLGDAGDRLYGIVD